MAQTKMNVSRLPRPLFAALAFLALGASMVLSGCGEAASGSGSDVTSSNETNGTVTTDEPAAAPETSESPAAEIATVTTGEPAAAPETSESPAAEETTTESPVAETTAESPAAETTTVDV